VCGELARYTGLLVVLEYPVKGAQPRVSDGRFGDRPQFLLDMLVVHVASGACFAVELCGREHWECQDRRRSDAAKSRAAAAQQLPIAWLSLEETERWQQQLAELVQQFAPDL